MSAVNVTPSSVTVRSQARHDGSVSLALISWRIPARCPTQAGGGRYGDQQGTAGTV